MTDKAQTFNDCSGCGADFTKAGSYTVIAENKIKCNTCGIELRVPKVYFNECYVCGQKDINTEKIKAQLSWVNSKGVKPVVAEVDICQDCLNKALGWRDK